MPKMLSVFFGSDRTYLSIIEPKPKGLELTYVESTENPIDLENPHNYQSQAASEELEEILKELKGKVDRLSVTLPSDSVLVSQFPSKEDISNEEIHKLVELEIKQAYPQFNYKDFISTVIPLKQRLDGKQTMMAVIISKQNFISCNQVLKKLKMPILNIEISQLNSHSTFLYNYPEYQDKTVALLGMANNFIDFSVIQNKEPIYYNLVSYMDEKKLGQILDAEFTKVMSSYAQFIDACYFFGSDITVPLLQKMQDTLGGLVMTIGRLNSFRMLSSPLDTRSRDYCSRTAHMYPPCIGGNLPAYHNRIRIF